ncbi:MAG: hypothetical protein KC443_25245, partial [Anaerolineales bacterium]|nr:hypothetical protein [Anaerolineales bacterium]
MKKLHLSHEQVEAICEPQNSTRYRLIMGTKLMVNIQDKNLVVSENYNGLSPDEYQTVQRLLTKTPPAATAATAA